MLVINCPGCSGPILKANDIDITRITITTKCPHCHRKFDIRVTREIVIVIDGKRIDAVPDGSIRML